MSPEVEVISAPTRRRKPRRFTNEALGALAEVLPTLARSTDRAKVGEHADENVARTMARDAQRELLDAYGLESRTSVFKNDPADPVFQATLQRKKPSRNVGA